MFLTTDTGCYADGAFGHQHVRETIASLLERLYKHHPRGGPGLKWDGEVKAVVESLRGEMPDDAWDENDALDLLNSYCLDETYFELSNGDLVLFGDEDEETDQ